MADAYELKEAEENWESIMERVEAGEEIVLMRDGVAVAVAKLVPIKLETDPDAIKDHTHHIL